MVQNKLPLINSAHGSETRNIINELIKLFNGMGYTYNESLKMSREILENARQTNNMNQDVQKQINNLILSDGESDAEVIQARGSFNILKNRLDNIDTNLAERAINIKNPPPPLVAAKGDGATNDYGAILGAVNHLISIGGGTIYIPDGHFTVNNVIEINSGNISIVGNGKGSHIQSTATTSNDKIFQSVGYDGLTFKGLRLTGQRESPTQHGNGHGIMIGQSRRNIITECSFENFSGKGVFFLGFMNGDLDYGVTDSVIRGNYMTDCQEGLMVYNDCHRIDITGNFIFNSTNPGIFIDDSHRMDGTETARACTAINTESNFVYNSRGTGIALAGTQFSSVKNNFVIDGGQTSGSNVDGIVLQSIQNDVMCNNNIVEGNTVAGNTNHAISLIAASENTIRGNNLINNSLNRSSGGVPHIRLIENTVGSVTTGSSDNIIEGNYSKVDSPNGSLTMHVLISTSDYSKRNVIRQNNFWGGAAGYHVLDRGVDTIIEDNMYNGKPVDKGFPDGDWKNPSITFKNSPGTGIFRNAADELAIAKDGSTVARFRNVGMQLNDGKDLILETTTGTRIGTSAVQKLGFWGKTPIARPDSIPQTSGKTLEELEQEVNKLKLLLRSLGLMN